MTTPGSSSPANLRQEIESLRAKAAALGQQMKKIMPLSDSNSTYRNDIIWLAQEINQIEQKVKDLEQKLGQVK